MKKTSVLLVSIIVVLIVITGCDTDSQSTTPTKLDEKSTTIQEETTQQKIITQESFFQTIKDETSSSTPKFGEQQGNPLLDLGRVPYSSIGSAVQAKILFDYVRFKPSQQTYIIRYERTGDISEIGMIIYTPSLNELRRFSFSDTHGDTTEEWKCMGLKELEKSSVDGSFGSNCYEYYPYAKT